MRPVASDSERRGSVLEIGQRHVVGNLPGALDVGPEKVVPGQLS